MFSDYGRGRRGNQALHRFIPYFYERGPSSRFFFFFTLIQDFSMKIVFTCCNSISYSTDRATFTFSRGKSSRLYRISDCVSSSFVNGMNSSYFFFFFLFLEMKFYFQFNSGTGDQTEKNHASLRSFNIFLSIVRLHPFSSPSPASF